MKKVLLFLILVLALIFLLYIPGVVSFGHQTLSGWQQERWGWNYIGTSMHYVVFFLYLAISKETKESFGLHFGRTKQHLIWLLLLTAGLIILMRFAAYITEGNLHFQIPLISTIIFQLLFVSFGEEMFWRGLIQTKFGLWVSSISFGAIHVLPSLISSDIPLATGIAAGVFATFMGFILGWVKIKTDSIYACAFLHGMYNLSNYIWVAVSM